MYLSNTLDSVKHNSPKGNVVITVATPSTKRTVKSPSQVLFG